MVLTGGVREVRRSRARRRCTSSTPRPLVSLVGVGRRAARRSVRRAGTVADAVVKKLEPRLLDAGQRRGARRPAENLAARNLYLQGRYHLNQRTDEGLHKALDFFEKAIVEDAQFALAHSGLADAHTLLAHYGVRPPSTGVGEGRVERRVGGHARRQLAPKGARRWRTSRRRRTGTGTAPSASSRCAIALDPRYATAHHWYAMSCLVPLGRLDEALDEMRIAQSLDPVSSIVARDLALIHAYRRDFEAALEQCDHTIELNPHFSPAYWTLGVIQEQRKDLDEAVAAFQRAIDLSPHSPRMHGGLARTLALAGRKPRRARRAPQARRDRDAALRLADRVRLGALRLGQRELGFRSLDKACEDRAFDVLALKVDPRFEPIRNERRFETAAKQMGLV